MDHAECENTPPRRFRRYRDGLIIALLAARSLRLSNLSRLSLDRTLRWKGQEWWIEIPASETKTKSEIIVPWPSDIHPNLERYLAEYRTWAARRKSALGQETVSALWLSPDGRPMHEDGIYRRVVARTREYFGAAINPHLFRDCATTSVAIDDPANIGIVLPILGHRNSFTAERHYNQARGIEASRAMQNVILALRRGATDSAE